MRSSGVRGRVKMRMESDRFIVVEVTAANCWRVRRELQPSTRLLVVGDCEEDFRTSCFASG
jgi:hypothetical protein